MNTKKLSECLKNELTAALEENSSELVSNITNMVITNFYVKMQSNVKWQEGFGPKLMSDNTRLYYRKGNQEIYIQEFKPQSRITNIKGNLNRSNNNSEMISDGESKKVFKFSVSYPFMVFVHKFIDEKWSESRCFFNIKPLETLEDDLYVPYMSNIEYTTMKLCLTSPNIDNSKSAINQIAQVMDFFWSSVARDEWSERYWEYKKYFQSNYPDLVSYEKWQKKSLEDPLFVIDDVPWIKADLTLIQILQDMFSKTNNSEFNELSQLHMKDIQENINALIAELVDSVIDENQIKSLCEKVEGKV